MPLLLLSTHFGLERILVMLPGSRFDTATSPYWLTEVREGLAGLAAV
jgi:hypothetical protein